LPTQPYTERALQEVCANLFDHLQNFIPDDRAPVVPRIC